MDPPTDRGPVEPAACVWAMPDPTEADENGVAGIGADLVPGTLLAAYRSGLFPMPVGGLRRPGPMGWWSPDPRGIIPLDGVQVSRSLRRSCGRYEVRVDTAFEAVIDACAEPNRPGGWITREVRDAYVELHRLGWAHSVETWAVPDVDGGPTPQTGSDGDPAPQRDPEGGPELRPGGDQPATGGQQASGLHDHSSAIHDHRRTGSRSGGTEARLVGGLYGVAIGGLFAGESMFHIATDASKVALVRLVELLRDDERQGAGRLLDVQWATDHLATLGALEVPRVVYLERLARALRLPLPRQLLGTYPRS